MMKIPVHPAASLLVLVLVSCFVGCGGEPSSDATPGSTTMDAEPVKEDILAVLRELNAALDKSDYALAVTFMQPFPDMTSDEMSEALARFQELREISAEGIGVLAEKGAFGPLLEIFPDRGKGFAERAGVDPDSCHALALQGAEVAGHWDGRVFRLIRLDDVGKLR